MDPYMHTEIRNPKRGTSVRALAITTYQRTIINCADMDYMNYADLYFQSIAHRCDTHPVAAMMIIIIIGSGPPAQFRTMRAHSHPHPPRIVKYIRAVETVARLPVWNSLTSGMELRQRFVNSRSREPFVTL